MISQCLSILTLYFLPSLYDFHSDIRPDFISCPPLSPSAFPPPDPFYFPRRVTIQYLHSYVQKIHSRSASLRDFCLPAYVFLRSAQQVRRPTEQLPRRHISFSSRLSQFMHCLCIICTLFHKKCILRLTLCIFGCIFMKHKENNV